MKWMNEDRTILYCDADGLSRVLEPGDALWDDAISGKFGEITPYEEPTAEEVQARLADEARAFRNRLLTSSDWTQVADAPVDRAAWAEYRQALRDVPDQLGFPADIIWPTAPTA